MLVLLYGIPGIFAVAISAAKILALADRLAEPIIARNTSERRRVAARLAFFALPIAVAAPLAWLCLPLLPDFREVGDGGIGMAWNFLAQLALCLDGPALACVALALVLPSLFPGRPLL